MNYKDYIEQHKDFFDNDVKIAYFEVGCVINKLFKRLSPEKKINFVKNDLLGLDYRYLTSDKIIYKLIPTLTNLNEEYKLHCDNLLSDISAIIITTEGLKGLTKKDADPVVYVGLGLNLSTTFDDFVGIKEASEIFGKSESTLKRNIVNGKFVEGIDCKKFGNSWIFSIDALEREYQ